MSMTLLNGDCLDKLSSIPNQFIDLVLTDPPYGTTACKWDSAIPLEPMWAQLKRIIKPKGAIVLFSAQPFTSFLITSNPNMFKYEWVWKKEMGTGFLLAKKQPLRDHENVLVFYSKQCTYNPQFTGGKPYVCKQGGPSACYENDSDVAITTINKGRRYPKTVQLFKRDKNKIHPTQKPVALMEYMINTYTNKGETVLDFTMGSGTTGVACKNTDRNFIGIELDEEYFEIAKKRIDGHIKPEIQEALV